MSQSTDTATGTPSPWDPFGSRWGDSDASRGERALDWFETLIWHDAQVCSECFARLKQSATDVRDDWGNEGTLSWRTESAELGEDLVEPPESVASVQPLPRQRTTCLECGSVRGLAQSDALTTQQAVDRVPALVERLQEAGYRVGVGVVYESVEHLKSDSERTDDDKRIFATAAAMGVQR